MATGHDGGGPSQSASNHPALASPAPPLLMRGLSVHLHLKFIQPSNYGCNSCLVIEV
jgi:hypothetical protein